MEIIDVLAVVYLRYPAKIMPAKVNACTMKMAEGCRDTESPAVVIRAQ